MLFRLDDQGIAHQIDFVVDEPSRSLPFSIWKPMTWPYSLDRHLSVLGWNPETTDGAWLRSRMDALNRENKMVPLVSEAVKKMGGKNWGCLIATGGAGVAGASFITYFLGWLLGAF